METIQQQSDLPTVLTGLDQLRDRVGGGTAGGEECVLPSPSCCSSVPSFPAPAPSPEIDILSCTPAPRLFFTAVDRLAADGGDRCGDNSSVTSSSAAGEQQLDKKYFCQRCLNHGQRYPRKGHKPSCTFRNCNCENCQMVEQRRLLNSALNNRKPGEAKILKGLQGPKPRNPKCARCNAHDIQSELRGHKKALCPWRTCDCEKCQLVEQRRKLMAKQIKLRRGQKKDRERHGAEQQCPGAAERTDQSPPSSHPAVRLPASEKMASRKRAVKQEPASLPSSQPAFGLPPAILPPSNFRMAMPPAVLPQPAFQLLNLPTSLLAQLPPSGGLAAALPPQLSPSASIGNPTPSPPLSLSAMMALFGGHPSLAEQLNIALASLPTCHPPLGGLELPAASAGDEPPMFLSKSPLHARPLFAHHSTLPTSPADSLHLVQQPVTSSSFSIDNAIFSLSLSSLLSHAVQQRHQ